MQTTSPTKTRFEPTRIAPETFLIHDHQGEGTGPVSVALNAMVIRAAQPVVVDTGMPENRETSTARRGRPHPADRAPTGLRLAHDPRPVRPDDRGVLGLGRLRQPDADAGAERGRARPRAVARGDAHLRPVPQPVVGPGRRGQVPTHRRPRRGAPAPGARRVPHAGDRIRYVADAIAATRIAPVATVAPQPDQSVLEAIQSVLPTVA